MPTTEMERPRSYHPGAPTGISATPEPPGWDLATERRIDDGETLARQIGWFSIGIGAVQVLAPDRLAEWLGMEEHTELIRLYGVRELVKGAGILSQRRPSPAWLHARIAGDVLDLAMLGAALARRDRKRNNVMAAMLATAGVMALDVICAQQLSQPRRRWDSQADRDKYGRAADEGGVR
jgi:hypothetical protein